MRKNKNSSNYDGMTSDEESASLDDETMSQGLLRLIQENISSLRDDMRDDIREVKDTCKEVQSDLGELKDELTGKEGVRERLFALETQVKALQKRASMNPPAQKGVKDHATTAGIATGAVAVIEVISQFLLKK